MGIPVWSSIGYGENTSPLLQGLPVVAAVPRSPIRRRSPRRTGQIRDPESGERRNFTRPRGFLPTAPMPRPARVNNISSVAGSHGSDNSQGTYGTPEVRNSLVSTLSVINHHVAVAERLESGFTSAPASNGSSSQALLEAALRTSARFRRTLHEARTTVENFELLIQANRMASPPSAMLNELILMRRELSVAMQNVIDVYQRVVRAGGSNVDSITPLLRTPSSSSQSAQSSDNDLLVRSNSGSEPRDDAGALERRPGEPELSPDWLTDGAHGEFAGAWDTMLTTLEPDSRLPSADSSFTSAAASASFSGQHSRGSNSLSGRSGRTHITVPSAEDTACESEDESMEDDVTPHTRGFLGIPNPARSVPNNDARDFVQTYYRAGLGDNDVQVPRALVNQTPRQPVAYTSSTNSDELEQDFVSNEWAPLTQEETDQELVDAELEETTMIPPPRITSPGNTRGHEHNEVALRMLARDAAYRRHELPQYLASLTDEEVAQAVQESVSTVPSFGDMMLHVAHRDRRAAARRRAEDAARAENARPEPSPAVATEGPVEDDDNRMPRGSSSRGRRRIGAEDIRRAVGDPSLFAGLHERASRHRIAAAARGPLDAIFGRESSNRATGSVGNMPRHSMTVAEARMLAMTGGAERMPGSGSFRNSDSSLENDFRVPSDSSPESDLHIPAENLEIGSNGNRDDRTAPAGAIPITQPDLQNRAGGPLREIVAVGAARPNMNTPGSMSISNLLSNPDESGPFGANNSSTMFAGATQALGMSASRSAPPNAAENPVNMPVLTDPLADPQLEHMRLILERMAQSGAIPEEWWMSAGLTPMIVQGNTVAAAASSNTGLAATSPSFASANTETPTAVDAAGSVPTSGAGRAAGDQR